VNRVGSAYFDQVKRTGHEHCLADLDLIAELGVRTVRYPVLWERTSPHGVADWTWPDQRFGKLRDLGIDVIAGLLHHGSGPAGTSLLDAEFPGKLARYARNVAERYPWLAAYTPVNEPLTTARFSCLYGIWYPHERNDRAFVRALLLQCRGIVQSMKAIRAVNPQAQLVQTEDLGKTHASPRLVHQADFENERRWLTFDLLCGRVNTHHPLWNYLTRNGGANESDVRWFEDNPCPPNVMGMNYYVTSERYLDDRVELFPHSSYGGNGRERYADVEAIRVSTHRIFNWGCESRLRELWSRYRRPVAITEAQLACVSESDQAAWLEEMWVAAQSAANDGADVRGFAAWALFGSYDWNSLLTRCDGVYEAGPYDSQRNTRRKAWQTLERLGRGEMPDEARVGSGWWRSPSRILYRPDDESRPPLPMAAASDPMHAHV
jgi:dTDP-4-dehydrorhamnose reductase